MTHKTAWLAAAAVLALTANLAPPAAMAATPAAAPTAPDATSAADVASPKFGAWGYDKSGEDPSTPAGTDFYRFANGAWVDHQDIPADRTRYGNFDKLLILSEARTRLLIEQAAAGHSSDADAAKVGAAYTAFMDQARVDALGAAPLAHDLDAIRAEKTHKDVAALMGTAPKSFQSGIFGAQIGADPKTPTRYSVYLGAGGMGLPDRDYYLKPEFAAKKQAYQAYAAQMLKLAGWPHPQESAAAILAFETRIAEASWTRAEQRDPLKTYNPMTVEALQAYAPGFDFRVLPAGSDLASTDNVIVTVNTAFPKIAAIFAATPVEILQAWQALQVIDSAAPYLADPFVQARFEFRSKGLAGQPQLQPRWKRGVAFVDGSLGEAVGRLYVAKYFTPEAKAKMDALVGNIKVAMAARIQHLDWMSPVTKARAEEKLSQFTVKIGYPVKWRDYSAYEVSATDLYGDAERSSAYEWERQVKRLNDPVDKLEWDMTPQTVNAYYNPSNNEIVFPAAILQPPFFDPDADPAVNYGGIGAVIGHEMTHGFDDQGRHYDGTGKLSDWWAPEDAAKFEAQITRLGGQYDRFEPVKGAFVKGELTMGENIADLGGVLLALDAYHTSLHGKPAPVVDGLTGEQRFFLGFAQIWREKIREDAQRQRLVTDPHSPAHYRVVGPLRNVDEWYAAFNVKPTDPVYLAPDQRARIW
jgi:putative endopeptidase